MPIGVANLQDIPALLEGLGQRIRDGELGEVNRLVLVMDAENGVQVRSWGGTGHILEAIGMLTIGASHLMAGE